MLLLKSSCTGPLYNIFLFPLKKMMNIIMIIAPILLIVSLIIIFFKGVMDPENKKLISKIKNAIVALICIFMLSVIINVVMNILGSKFNVTECWNKASAIKTTDVFYTISNRTKKPVFDDPSIYDKGKLDMSNEYTLGKLPVDTSDRNLNARNAAVNWAVNIANDNSFHYGKKEWAHHFGCYFCGTNQKSGSIKRRQGGSLEQVEKTYCCNPFVTAAYAHGAGAPEISCTKSGKKIGLANDNNKALQNKNNFKRISKPSSITALEPGDILLSPSHAMMYAGNGKVVHASGSDDGIIGSTKWNNSIRVSKPGGAWGRVTKIYRYLGNGKF